MIEPLNHQLISSVPPYKRMNRSSPVNVASLGQDTLHQQATQYFSVILLTDKTSSPVEVIPRSPWWDVISASGLQQENHDWALLVALFFHLFVCEVELAQCVLAKRARLIICSAGHRYNKLQYKSNQQSSCQHTLPRIILPLICPCHL